MLRPRISEGYPTAWLPRAASDHPRPSTSSRRGLHRGVGIWKTTLCDTDDDSVIDFVSRRRTQQSRDIGRPHAAVRHIRSVIACRPTIHYHWSTELHAVTST